MRIDVWLWSVRVYKTRAQATAACRAGHVKVGGASVKAAYPVKIGDRVSAKTDALMTRQLEVTGFIHKRVSATEAAKNYVDHTPPPPPREAVAFVPVRPRGAGKPSKRELREINRLRGRE